VTVRYNKPITFASLHIYSLSSNRLIQMCKLADVIRYMRSNLKFLASTVPVLAKKAIKGTQRFDKSYLPRPPTLRYSTTVVGWGPGHSQLCQVSSKSVQGFSLPEGSKSAIFLCYRPTCDDDRPSAYW